MKDGPCELQKVQEGPWKQRPQQVYTRKLTLEKQNQGMAFEILVVGGSYPWPFSSAKFGVP